MRIPRLFTALALALYIPSATATIVIRTAAQESTEPKFVALQQNGAQAIGGICVDIMRAIEEVDPEIQFVGDQSWQPISRSLAGLRTGGLDVICGTYHTKSREAEFNFSETPLFSVNFVLAVRANDNVQIANWDDVQKLGNDGIILVNQGYGVVDVMRKVDGLKIDASANSSKSNLYKLLAGRGRFFLYRSPGISTEIRKFEMQDKVKLLPAVMGKEYLYMAISKKLSVRDANRLEAAIASLRDKGILVKIFNKYLDQ